MNSDPIRLLDGTSLSKEERELLVEGRDRVPFRYDVNKGLARFSASLASMSVASTASIANATGEGTSTATAKIGSSLSKLLVKLSLTVAVPITVVATVQLVNHYRNQDKNLEQKEVVGVPAPKEPKEVFGSASDSVSTETVSRIKLLSDRKRERAGLKVGSKENTPAELRKSERRSTHLRALSPSRTSDKFKIRKRDLPNPPTVENGNREVEIDSITVEQGEPLFEEDALAASKTAENKPIEKPAEEAKVDSRSQSVKISRVTREMRAIARSRRLLASDPEEALTLLEKTGQSYPNGYFVEERRALTIFALVAVGQKARAKTQAELFLRDYPNGPFTNQVRATSIPHKSDRQPLR